MISNIIVL